MAYLWTKTAHLVFVMAWMGGVFYLPRILVNLAEAGEDAAVRARLVLMGRRLYRFGHVMFGLAFVLGLALWLHFGIAGGWLHAKLLLVALMLAHFIVAGRWLKGAEAGTRLPSARMPAGRRKRSEPAGSACNGKSRPVDADQSIPCTSLLLAAGTVTRLCPVGTYPRHWPEVTKAGVLRVPAAGSGRGTSGSSAATSRALATSRTGTSTGRISPQARPTRRCWASRASSRPTMPPRSLTV